MEYTGFCNQVNKISEYQPLMSNSFDIHCMNDSQEIRKDIEIENVKYTKIWGQVKNHCNQPVVGEYVRVVKIYQDECGEYLEILNRTITDERGCYTLDLYTRENEKYAIIVDHQDTLSLKSIENNTLQSGHLKEEEPQNYRVTPSGSIYPLQGRLPRTFTKPCTIAEYNKHKCISSHIKSCNHF